MVGTVENVSTYTNNRESAKDTALGSLFDTLANCRDIFLRNRTADNAGLELEQLLAVRIHRLEVNLTVTVLTTSTGLLCVLTVNINSLGDCFLVCNLRCTNVCFNLELTKQTVYDDLQVELTHTSDDGLTSFLIGMSTEGRVFFSKLCQSLAHLALTSLGLRLDCKLDNRLRELHGLKDYRMLLITDCITGSRKLEAYCCSDITGVNLIQLLTLICVHLHDTAYTLLLALGSIQNIGTGIQCTGIYSEVSKLTYKRVSHDLECKSCERLIIRRVSLNFVAFHVSTLDCRDISRCRHEIKNCIQKLLNASVSVSTSAAYRNCGTLAAALTQAGLQLCHARLLTLKICHHQIVVQLADLLYQLSTIQLCIISHIFRDIGNCNIIALIIVVDVSFHLKQVDDTLELVLFADRQLSNDCVLS